MERVIEVKGIKKAFGDHEVLKGVDFAANKGEVTCIIGSSGSGKSTLTRVLFGLGSADSGEITYRGQTMGKRGSAVRRMLRGQTGLVFQDPFASLDPRWRVARSVEEPLRLHHKGMGNDEIASQAEHALRVVGLDPAVFAARYPMDLSGGQAQRVAIARALITKPKLVFADEPTGNLDSVSSAEVLSFLKRSVNELGQTIIMVTHDAVAASYADRALVFADGQIVADVNKPTADQMSELLMKEREAATMNAASARDSR